MNNAQLGLVLSGGGGKGAYEIGVWKALEERGIRPRCVSGTSIGAINGALYLQRDINLAEQMWYNLDKWQLVVPNLESLAKCAVGAAIKPHLAPLIAARGVLDTKGLRRLLEERVDMRKICGSEIPFFVAAHDCAENRANYFRINDQQPSTAREMILASAALPCIFPPVPVDGRDYSDGGWHLIPGRRLDNTPIEPLHKAGCSVIIAVMLSRDEQIDRSRFRGTVILPIAPTADLGGIVDGVLDASVEGARRRIEMGYADATRVLDGLAGQETIRVRSEELFAALKKGEDVLCEPSEREAPTDLRALMNRFNRGVLGDSFSEDIPLPDFTEVIAIPDTARSLLREEERRKIAIDVERFLTENTRNEDALSEALLEGISLLAPHESRSRALRSRGFFGRFLGALTGKSEALHVETADELSRAQYAAFSMIRTVQEKNILSLELTVAANTKINALFGELTELRDEARRDLAALYTSLSAVFLKLRKEILDDRKRIDSLEKRVGLVEWRGHIAVRTFNGAEYRSLPPAEAFVCIVNDFYRITGGDWNIGELLTLKAALVELRLADISVRPAEFFGELRTNAVPRLTEGLRALRQPTVESADMLPALRIRNSGIAPRALWQAETDCASLAVQILIELRRHGYRPVSSGNIGEEKTDLTKRLDALERIASRNGLAGAANDARSLAEEIRAFSVAVPLLGGFSAGKTTMINKHLGREILSTGLAPETSVATELRASDEERMVVRFLDGSVETRPVNDIERIVEEARRILKIELHLNNAALRTHPNAVIVDMPGLDSANEAHNKAIQNYISSGTAFILCVPADQGIHKSTLDTLRTLDMLGQELSVLITRCELRAPEIDAVTDGVVRQIKSVFDGDVPVGRVSSVSGDIEGFRCALGEIDRKASELLRERFASRIRKIADDLLSMLGAMKKNESTDRETLEEERKKLAEKKTAMRRILDDEEDRLRRDFRDRLPDILYEDILYALRQNRSSLQDDIRKGTDVSGSVQGIVQQTLRRRVEQHTSARFSAMCVSVGRRMRDKIPSGGLAVLPPEFFAREISVAKEDMIGSTAMTTIMTGLGLLLGGPVGAIILGAFGKVFGSRRIKKAEEEAFKKLEEAIDSVAAEAKVHLRAPLEEIVERLCEEMENRVASLEEDMESALDRIEERVRSGEATDEERKKDLARDIEEIRGVAPK